MSGSAGGTTLRDFFVSISYQEHGRKEFLGGLAVVTNQAVELGKSIAQAAIDVTKAVARIAGGLDDLYFASRRTGASVESIKALSFAVSQMGGSVEGARSSLENMGRFLRTNPGSEGFIQGLGVSTRNANGQLRDTGEMLVDLGAKLRRMPFYQANAYAGVLGIDEKTLLALIDNVGGFSKQYKEMYAAAGIDAQRAARDSHAFMVEVSTLGNAFTILGEKVASILTKQMSEDIRRFRVWLVSNFDTISRAIVWVAARLMQAADVMILIANRAGNMVKSVAGYLFGLDPGTKAAAIAIGLVTLAVLAMNFAFNASPLMLIWLLALAIAALADDYNAWKKGGKSLIDWKAWEAEINLAKAGIKDFLNDLREMWKAIGEGHDSILFPISLSKSIHDVLDAIHLLVGGLNNLLELQDAISKRDWIRAYAVIKRMAVDGSAAVMGATTPEAGSGLLPGQDANFASRLNNIFSGRITPNMGVMGRIGELFRPTLASRGGAGGAAGPTGGGIARDMEAPAKASYDFWIGKGLAPSMAAAMAANEMGESRGDPGARGDGGNSHGLYQHDASRRARLLKEEGVDMSTASAEQQREATYKEMSRGYDAGAARAWAMLQAGGTTTEGVAAGVDHFERSANRPRDKGIRQGYADDILRRYGPAALSVVPAPSVAPRSAAEMEQRRGLSQGMLRGMEPPVPLGAPNGGNDNRITHAPVLNQTTNITVQGGPDANRAVLEGQRSVNQDNVRALSGTAR